MPHCVLFLSFLVYLFCVFIQNLPVFDVCTTECLLFVLNLSFCASCKNMHILYVSQTNKNLWNISAVGHLFKQDVMAYLTKSASAFLFDLYSRHIFMMCFRKRGVFSELLQVFCWPSVWMESVGVWVNWCNRNLNWHTKGGTSLSKNLTVVSKN